MADRHLVAEDRVDQGGDRAEVAALAGAGPAPEIRRGLDHGVRAEFDVDVDERRAGIDDRHPRAHVALEDAPLRERPHHGEVGAVVDAERHAGIIHLERGERFSQSEGPPDSDRQPRDKPLRGAKL